MRKISLLLNRTILILGLLIVLTPCGICSAAVSTASSQVKACCMAHMDAQGCCHSRKSQEPYCKAMNQSSVVPALHGTVFASKPPVVFAVAEALASFQAGVVPSAVVSSSPPRGILALRI